MRLWHPVEMQKTLFSSSEDRLAVDFIVRIYGGVQDVSGFRLCVNNLDVAFLGQVSHPFLVLFGKILAQKELGLDVVTLGN